MYDCNTIIFLFSRFSNELKNVQLQNLSQHDSFILSIETANWLDGFVFYN